MLFEGKFLILVEFFSVDCEGMGFFREWKIVFVVIILWVRCCCGLVDFILKLCVFVDKSDDFFCDLFIFLDYWMKMGVILSWKIFVVIFLNIVWWLVVLLLGKVEMWKVELFLI